ncbi:GNAT family N-acetyltransferase [Rhodococcus aerolatus]
MPADVPDLRPAHPGDAAAIAELHTTVWREAYRGLVPDAYLDAVTPQERCVRWTHRLVSGGRQAVLALRAGEVVGAVSWSDGAAGLELTSVYLLPPHRGRGVAERLVDRAIGGRPAFLWVFEANHRARAFYRRVGFVLEGRRAVDAGTGVPEIRLERP